MSHNEFGEIEQIDELAAELAEAGRTARVATAFQERPEPTFAMRLRTELLRQLPSRRGGIDVSPAEDGQAAAILLPDGRIERRFAQLPFIGRDRRVHETAEVPVIYADATAGAENADAARAGRRWNEAAATATTAATAATADLDPEEAEGGHIVPLKASMRWHIPTRVMPSRVLATGLAASVAVAVFAYGSGIFWPGKPSATVSESIGASLTRGGVTSALVTGMQINNGDEITVSAAGRATLQLDTSIVRMAPGADLKIGMPDSTHVIIDQIAGRAYHRAGAGDTYEVKTAGVSWQGGGNAFDLDRHNTSGGGEVVQGLAIYRTVGLVGPAIQSTLPEGTSATIVLRPDGSVDGTVALRIVDFATLTDSWLVGNAQEDSRLGLPLGELASLVSPEPTLEPTAEPSAVATTVPTDTTANPTAAPTAKPTPKPTTKPTANGPAALGKLTISANGGNSYSFNWPKYTGTGFEYYKLVYGPWGTTPSYPDSPYWACPSSVWDHSWTGNIDAGDYAVRVQVVDTTSGKTIIRAQTPVVRLKVTSLPATIDLGALWASPSGPYTFHWTGYSGGYDYSYYKLVYEPYGGGKDPSYTAGSPIWGVPAAGSTSFGPVAIVPGDYWVRIQAIGYPFGSAYVYGQTAVFHLKVDPPATPAPPVSASPTL